MIKEGIISNHNIPRKSISGQGKKYGDIVEDSTRKISPISEMHNEMPADSDILRMQAPSNYGWREHGASYFC
jgi:hypothetical protein